MYYDMVLGKLHDARASVMRLQSGVLAVSRDRVSAIFWVIFIFHISIIPETHVPGMLCRELPCAVQEYNVTSTRG
jgi:hypothetical protein